MFERDVFHCMRLFFLCFLHLFILLPVHPSLFSEESPSQTPSEQVEEREHATPNFHALFFKTMLLVGGLLAATTAGLYLLKRTQARFFQAKGEADIQILERRSLSPKTQVFLLSIKGKELVVVESAHQIHMHSTPSFAIKKQESL